VVESLPLIGAGPAWFIGKKFAFFRRKTPLLRLEFFSF
jgi:hypothetical protein